MGPTRTSKNHRQALDGSSVSRKSGPPEFKSSRAGPSRSSVSLPSVQKLKVSLRQTRRLLAKDNIAADVRVTTERRLRALEGELAVALRAKAERAMATRYHKVRFFERQKVTRKINQVKRQISSNGDDAELSSALVELRVDLNYILHYPKTKKYISLFPPEVREGKEAPDNKERDDVRTWIREKMDKGEIPAEPDLVDGSRQGEGTTHVSSPRSWKTHKADQGKDAAAGKHVGGAGRKSDDDFFGEDDVEAGSDHESDDDDEEEE